jgi:hypothetical protein
MLVADNEDHQISQFRHSKSTSKTTQSKRHERQDITEKQRQYKSEIERAYTLKTTGPNQGSINPPRLYRQCL